MFNREKEVKHLFSGTNRLEDLGLPVVMFAPVGSGKSTILRAGAAIQPDTLMCTLRAGEKTDVPMSEAEFVYAFAKSIGLSERSQHLPAVANALNRM
jgi:hypothetical protein